MKKLLLLLLFVTGITNAQIVNIPDAKFKAKLIALGVDTDADGQIQNTEALAKTTLDVSNSTISSLSGIEAFTNITSLKCKDNSLSSLDISKNIKLQTLDCSSNVLNSLDISQNINLRYLDCFANHLTSLNVSLNPNLEYLKCADNWSLHNLDVTHNAKLQQLICFDNYLSTLDVSQNVNLYYLHCAGNQLTSLDVTQNVSLQTLRCSSNLIESLDISQNKNLQNFECYNNSLTTIDVSHNINLQSLDCFDNQLTSIDITQNINLTSIQCGYNQLTDLDVSQNVNLQYLYCEFNQLVTLDLTKNSKIFTLKCDNNKLTTVDVSNFSKMIGLQCGSPQLNTIFMKNGKSETLTLISSPNLKYICADEDQVSSVQSKAGSNVVVSSYCSFVPGGDINTVSGVVRFDMDNNGCDASDLAFPNSVHLNITNGTVSSGVFPAVNGEYILYTTTGNHALTTVLENPDYFTITPTMSTVNFPALNNSIQTQDFCIATNGVHNDIEVVIIPITPARPGFDAVYQIVYKNKGNQTVSGNIDFVYDDSVLDYVSANVEPNSQSTGNLNWAYSDLLPFESRSFMFTLNVNSPMETLAVKIGDILSFIVTINPVSSDEMPVDNNFPLRQKVVGSYDPNNMTCLEGDVVSPTKIGDYLHYNVNFENTGTFAAENIVVRDIIDTAKYDMASLQVMNASHQVSARVTDNKVEFIFENIELGAHQHGNVVFKIKTKNTLITGNSVANKADIYFDYNAPVPTNTASTTFQALAVSDFEVDNSVSVYPNPAKTNISINCNNNINTVQLFDVQGRVLVTKTVDDSHSDFDISNYSNGVYFLKITTEKGMKTEKILKD